MYALESRRHSMIVAPRPTSQVTMANTVEMPLAARAATRIRSSVYRPKNTVPVIRAQLLPRLLAHAIQSHRPTPMMPAITTIAISALTSVLILEAEEVG